MSETNIGEIVAYYWLTARRTKSYSSGWISGDAVCCHHRGHRADTRKRGGVKTETDGTVVYSCFNCGFSASWSPGKLLNGRMRQLCDWLNVPDDDIRRMSFAALKLSDQSKLSTNGLATPTFDTVTLPERTFVLDNQTPVHILNYVLKRRLEHQIDNLYYCKLPEYSNLLIFPLYYNSRLVGWTGRNTHSASRQNRYIKQLQPGYVYGLDNQHYEQKFVVVTEGLIDAIHMKGIALMGSNPNKSQLGFINRLRKPVIYVPDRDEKGEHMVNVAIENNWSVSLPEWSLDIKDISDAVERYGRIATFASIVKSTINSKTKIRLLKRHWFKT